MLHTAEIFDNNMILQHGKTIRIWGTAKENSRVTVRLCGCQVATTTKNGCWEVFLPPLKAQINGTLEVDAEGEKIMMTNVAVGEVWVAGGQSNMEFLLKYDAQKESVIALEDLDIRFYDVPKISYPEQEQIESPCKRGGWLAYTKENAENFSAVGIYFARKLREKLQVPIGIISCNWGGTPAVAWLDPNFLQQDKALEHLWQQYMNNVMDLDEELQRTDFLVRRRAVRESFFCETMDAYMYGTITPAQMAAFVEHYPFFLQPQVIGPMHQNRPGGLFQSMVQTIAEYTVKGVIWYQGEADSNHAECYSKLFTAVIASWRQAWMDILPFVFVQLAPFGSQLGETGERFPEVREQQELVAKTVPKAYMISIMDVGDQHDIHPKHKRLVGERLALVALSKVYNELVLSDFPEAERVQRRKGGCDVFFRNAEEGLTVRGSLINDVQLFDGDREVLPSSLSVYKNVLHIECSCPVTEIRFAWKAYANVNLYQTDGFPVKPFKFQIP